MAPGERTIEQLIADARRGDRSAVDGLMQALWPELRRIAASQMRGERQDHTWQPTALVNELYLELLKAKSLDGDATRNDRNGFLGLASHMMMRLLIHHARPLYRRVQKTSLQDDSAPELATDRLSEVETLLASLGAIDPQLRTVVEMKVFEGHSSEEMAARLGCSLRTVERRWTVAKHWLEQNLR